LPSEARLKQLEARLREIKQKKIKLLQMQRDYKRGNLLEFFNLPKEEGGMPANPLQAELLEAFENPQYKVFTYTGANRIGKTTILAIIAFSVIFGKWLWSDKKIWFPHSNPRKVRLIGQDWEKHIKAVLVPALKKWWPQKRKLKVKKNNAGVEYYWEDVVTGSTLEIMSNLQDSDLHEGWDGDLILYDEPPKRDIRVANARGLIDRQGRELFAMTLLKEAWVDREVIKAVDDDGKPDRSVFSVDGDITVNVGFGITQEGVDQFAKTLTEEEKSARLHGKPSYLSGLVYPQFNRKTHMIERFDIPTNWMVDIALDIHPRERQAALFVATDERNERYGCDEIWEHGDGDAIVDEVLRRISRSNYRVNRIIIDPLSKSTGEAQRGVDENSTFNKIRRRLWQHDYALEVASKDKTSGILEVRNHLLGPNKKPSIWFFDDLVRVLFEFEGYMYKDGKVMDADDHQMENLYRILLCDTHYVEPDDEDDEEEDYHSDRVNSVTGY
jgi:hypothetical protein